MRTAQRAMPFIDTWGDGEWLASVADMLPAADTYVDPFIGDGHVYLNYTRASHYILSDPDPAIFERWVGVYTGDPMLADLDWSYPLDPNRSLPTDSLLFTQILYRDKALEGKPVDLPLFRRNHARMRDDAPMLIQDLDAVAQMVISASNGGDVLVFCAPPLAPRSSSHSGYITVMDLALFLTKISLPNVLWVALVDEAAVPHLQRMVPAMRTGMAYQVDVGEIPNRHTVRFAGGMMVPPKREILLASERILL